MKLGYEGEGLREFVANERDRQEKKLEQDRKREERRIEREEQNIRRELDEKEAQRQHDMKIAQNELEALKARANIAGKSDEANAGSLVKTPHVKIPAYEDGKDNLDAYIDRFERFARSQGWKRETWGISLSALLKGKALEVYSGLAPEESSDYDKLKSALLKRFQMTEEGYKTKFRTCRPERGETPCQFVARLSNYFHRWVDLSKIEHQYESLVDLLLREQFIQACSKDLATFLKEKKCPNINELAESAERYTDAHGLSSFTGCLHNQKSNFGRFQRTNGQQRVERKEEPTSGKPNIPKQVERRCFICYSPSHLAKDCRKNFKNPTAGPKTAAYGLNTHPTQGGTKSNCSCNKGYVIDAKDDKVGYLTNNIPDKGKRNKNCSFSQVKQETNIPRLQVQDDTQTPRKPQMPTCKGILEGKLVTVLRDSGCTCAVVKRDCVPKEKLLGFDQTCVLIDGTIRKCPLAKVQVDTPYYTGEIKALCMQEPAYDLVIGNVDGVREPGYPDPTWAAPVLKESETTQCSHDHDCEVQAVETRQMKKRKETPIRPLQVPSPIAEVSAEEFLIRQKGDKTLKPFWEKAENKTKEDSKYEFIVKNKFLYRKRLDDDRFSNQQDQLIVPVCCRVDVLKMAHDGLMAGHQGIRRTYDRVRSHFYWPGMQADVTRFCRSCDVCQRTLPKGKVTKVPLGRMPLIDTPFKRIAMDLVGPIHPASDRGHRYILTVMDYATRYPEAVALTNIDTITVSEALVDIYARLGVPSEILTDMGTQFTSDLMREVSRLLSIKQLTTTVYHPICNGMTEKFNGTLKLMLKRMCAERPKDWDRYLSALLFCYREAPHESIGFSPFEILYGRLVRGPMAVLRELWTKEEVSPEVKSTYQYVLDLKDRLHETCELAQKMAEKSALKYKKYYDQKKRGRDLKVGDQVLILLPTDNNKLLMQWKGPFKVVEKFNNCDYRIDINGNIKCYHINLLKKYVTRNEAEETMGILAYVSELEVAVNDGECTDRLAYIKGEDVEADHRIIPLPGPIPKETIDDVMCGKELQSEQLVELKSLLDRYSQTFTDIPKRTNVIECEIKLTTDDPVRSSPHKVPYSVREVIRKEVSNMLDMSVIERANSKYCSPVVLIAKKDNTVRFCIDYRKLNRVTVFDPEPLPNPEDLFVQLSKSKYLSKIDMMKGYWQIPMAEASKDKTAFVTPEGQFRFVVMPFGLVNSGQIFTRLVRKLFHGVSNVMYYVDDILIYTENWEDHMNTLSRVLMILENANLSIRPSKCFLGYRNLEFLGHNVGEGALTTSPVLLKKIQETERPSTKKQIRSFIGLTSFYRKYIPNFSEVALPLTDLTRKGQPTKVEWGEPQEKAYMTLKALLAKPPILKLPDFSKQFVLRTDASDLGIAAILMQEHDNEMFPVAFASKKLLQRQRNYSTIERECLSIIWAVQKFEAYLWGRDFVIQTDHQPLTYINQTKVINKKIMRWAMILQEFRFRVESIPGNQNFGPDFLSRVPGE